jgi:hypothetical protein
MSIKKVKKEVKILLTPQDKFHLMAKKNKMLVKLKETFNLELI